MIITPEFVFVHLSKTGGTFVAQVLRELRCPSVVGRKIHRLRNHYGVPIPLYPYAYGEAEQHGLCGDIPRNGQDKPIVSIIRNPFDLYVSEYTFKWWIKHHDEWFEDSQSISSRYPQWKEFSFREFFDVSKVEASWVQRTLKRHPKAANLGWYSHKFVYYYCKNYDRVFEAAPDPDEFLRRVKEEMYPVRFLHTDNLNQELYQLLRNYGYPESKIGHIPHMEKVNASRKEEKWSRWYSNDHLAEIKERDSLIFGLFPEFEQTPCGVIGSRY